ncbi:MAG: hypothetical protein WC584_03885 [Candidatus Pacearchaeota archaeon]
MKSNHESFRSFLIGGNLETFSKQFVYKSEDGRIVWTNGAIAVVDDLNLIDLVGKEKLNSLDKNIEYELIKKKRDVLIGDSIKDTLGQYTTNSLINKDWENMNLLSGPVYGTNEKIDYALFISREFIPLKKVFLSRKLEDYFNGDRKSFPLLFLGNHNLIYFIEDGRTKAISFFKDNPSDIK